MLPAAGADTVLQPDATAVACCSLSAAGAGDAYSLMLLLHVAAGCCPQLVLMLSCSLMILLLLLPVAAYLQPVLVMLTA